MASQWQQRKDLFVLVADDTMRLAVEALLSRYRSLGIRSVEARVVTHARRDAAVLRECHEFLRPFLSLATHALVMFDREGCGSEEPREALEADVEARLAQNGWELRSAAVVIDPELDVWVWSDSPHVDATLGWRQHGIHLRTWLAERGFLQPGHGKPERPKEALDAALRNSNKRRSSSLYFDIATRVSFERCADPAFLKLKSTLQRWFPSSPPILGGAWGW